MMNVKELTDRELLAIYLRVNKERLSPDVKLYEILQSPRALGLPETAVSQLHVAEELTRRLIEAKSRNLYRQDTLEALPKYLFQKYRYETQEHFVAVPLDPGGHVLGYEEIAIGGLDRVTLSGRELFRKVLKYPTIEVVLVHNHPGGEPKPSKDDYEITRRFCSQGKLLDIFVSDHIIIGDESYISMDLDKYFDFETGDILK